MYTSSLEWMELLALQGLSVEVVLPMTRPDPLEIGDVIPQLFDTVHFFCYVVIFKEVTHLFSSEREREREI